MKTTFRADFRCPHPLGNLAGVRRGFNQEQMKRLCHTGTIGEALPQLCPLFGMGKNDHFRITTGQHFLRRNNRMSKLVDSRDLSQGSVLFKGPSTSLCQPGGCKKFYQMRFFGFCDHGFTFFSHSSSKAIRCIRTALARALRTLLLGGAPYFTSNIAAPCSVNFTRISHSPFRLA